MSRNRAAASAIRSDNIILRPSSKPSCVEDIVGYKIGIIRKTGCGEEKAIPVTYQIDSERNLVIFTASGVLEEHEYKECRASLVDDPQFRPGMDQIADFRAVEKQVFTQEGHDRFIEQEKSLKLLFGKYHQAIVAYSDLHFGLTRQILAELGESPKETQVFHTLAEAEAWLFADEERG